MSETDDLTRLRAMYAAESEYLRAGGPGVADAGTVLGFFDPNVVLHQAPSLPFGGVWRGHDGMARFFAAMSATWTRFEMVEQEFLSTTSPLVVLTWVEACTATTGRDLSFPILQTVVMRHGLITEVRPFYWDTAQIQGENAP